MMRSFLLCALVASTSAFVARPPSRRVFSVGSQLASSTTAAANDEPTVYEELSLPARPGRPLKVAIAGGGVGGLTAALCMLKNGFDVTVYEKTAAFARFGGPIQFASNALSVLKEIDETLFQRVMEKFTFTGTRTCGIKDGLRADGSFRMTDDSIDYLWNPDAPADWFVKFPLKVSLSDVGHVCYMFNRHCFRDSLDLLSNQSNARISLVFPTRALLIGPTFKTFSLMNVRNARRTSFQTEIQWSSMKTWGKERESSSLCKMDRLGKPTFSLELMASGRPFVLKCTMRAR